MSEGLGMTSPSMSWKTVMRTCAVLLAIPLASAGPTSLEIPCVEFSAAININCLCSLNEENATRINCDNVVFPGDFPVLPFRYYIQVTTSSLSSKNAVCANFLHL